MPTSKADIFTLAKFGDFKLFKSAFNIEKINIKHSSGSGLLHYAISGNQFEIASFLIQNHIDVNMLNANGQSVAHLIGVNQNVDVAKELFDAGIDINIKDQYGNTALWTAVFNCKGVNYQLVELIMNLEIDIDSKNNSGRSPLDFAKQIGDDRLVKILLKQN